MLARRTVTGSTGKGQADAAICAKTSNPQVSSKADEKVSELDPSLLEETGPSPEIFSFDSETISALF